LYRADRCGLADSSRLGIAYAFYVFWALTAFDTVTMAVVLRRAARRTGVLKKTTKTLLFYAVPLYVLFLVTTTIFVGLEMLELLGGGIFAPSGAMAIVMAVIFDVLYTAVAAVLIHLGLENRRLFKSMGSTTKESNEDLVSSVSSTLGGSQAPSIVT